MNDIRKLLFFLVTLILTGMPMLVVAADSLDQPQDTKSNICLSSEENRTAAVLSGSRIENSKKLHACISFLIGYNTEEMWDENYDFLSSYVAMARDILAGGDYDINYMGLDKLLVMFEPINSYFNQRLINTHLAHINAELEKYDESEYYFEKYGISVKLRDYIITNSISLEQAELSELIKINEQHINELVADSEKYDSFLLENTSKFIERCYAMKEASDYHTLKALYKEAEYYYFNMDFSNQDLSDFIPVFHSFAQNIESIEKYAAEFIDAALAIPLADEDGKFYAIANASGYLDELVREVDGVGEAMKIFNEECKMYDLSISAANAELEKTCVFAVVVRCFDGTEEFSSYIMDVLTK